MAVVEKRILVDTSKCIGCRGCQVACQQWHSLTTEDTTFTGTYQNPPDMSGTNLTVAKFTEIEDAGKVKWLFFKDMCRHCDAPACKVACIWHAIKRKANGMVYIDHTICDPNVCTSGRPYLDRPCMSACPYHVPKWKYIKNGATQGLKAMKCDFCYNRFGLSGADLGLPQKSRKPSCVVTCPPGAIKVGKYGGILSQARNRVTYLQNNGYPCANVYPPQALKDVIDCGLGSTLSRKRLTHVIWVLTEHPSVYGL